ncbi:MAG: cytochrome [Novosphingobium lindaniclasticum]|jgi:cytochrome c553|uniref:c-type cytochrome n=1 Tax=Novosphingobium lindaniclasticum TaxID=1329895 RepID=UPI0024093F2C|nr:c-type cytochrome [Novosphingobium lindaniclasticum]MDF2639482.1 cytochrome [Novosphingobium lindaniclasticum]
MTVKLTLKRLILGALALAALGMAFAWSGLFPIAASSGHWAITDWFLHWTMQNSARTYSAFQTPEHVREDRALVSAAGHFHQSCEVCHGAPGVPRSPVMQAASPPAPDLARTVGDYSDRELFWIVRHGVKYTGMPAWAAEGRDDEVGRMVGFLRRLPAMAPAEYSRLVGPQRLAGSAAGGDSLARCTGCHGVDGRGRGQTDIPVIAGQKPDYILKSLQDFAAGKRRSAVMQAAATGLSEAEMREAARHFASLPGLTDSALPASHPIVAEGLRGEQLPACRQCHAPGKAAPLLSGQRPEYLAARLRQWRGDETVVDARKPRDPMATIARRIPEADIDALAQAAAAPAR